MVFPDNIVLTNYIIQNIIYSYNTMSLAKKEEQMVFHTGAALLDAIVLASQSYLWKKREHMDTGSRRM